MNGNARAEIFARLRHSADNRSSNEILRESWTLGHAPLPDFPAENLHEAFLINVLKNHGTVDHASDRSEAVKAVARYVYEKYRTQRLVAGNDARLAALPWRDGGLLPRFGSVEPGEPVALGYARLGIAELGAIVTCTGRANPSVNNLLPEHHIVLVDSADIVATSEDAWSALASSLNEGERPRGINFIAGPSSTADIEATLVYGAHGPRALHVILVGKTAKDVLQRAQQALNPEQT